MLNKNTTEEMMEEILEENEMIPEEVEEIDEEEMEQEEETEEEQDNIFVGTVINCDKLNVREEPSLKGKPICQLNKGSELMVDLSESTDEWYKVYLESGFSGFCMKAYVGGE